MQKSFLKNVGLKDRIYFDLPIKANYDHLLKTNGQCVV